MNCQIGFKVKVVKKVFEQIEVGDIGNIEYCYDDWPPRPNPTYSVRFDHVDYPFYFQKSEIEIINP